MKIELYQPEHKKLWDRFIDGSKNGNFHLKRDFIEYHGSRFQDHSLLVFDEKDKLLTILPANRDGDTIYSHQGLSYGSFILEEDMKLLTMLQVIEEVFLFLKKDFRKLIYKTVPGIYALSPAQEDLFALFHCETKLVRRDVLPVIDQRNKLKFQERRARGVAKARKNNLLVMLSQDLPAYWEIINYLLAQKSSKPVHSLEEITYLKSKFPENIKLFACISNGKMLAGILIFESPMVARMQYIGATGEGKNLGAIDLVTEFLINEYYSAKPYIDFGSATTHGGKFLSAGNSENKEGFGARTIVQDSYEVNLAKWDPENFRKAIQ